jgi:hypothetical protein
MPTQRGRGEWFALERIEQRIIPDQKKHPQLWALPNQCRDQFDEVLGIPIVRSPAFANQPGAAVEIPADQKDGGTRFDESPT